MNVQDGISLGEAGIITLFSMGLVFATLIVISIVLGGFKSIFYKEESKKAPVKKEAPVIGDNVATDAVDDSVDNERLVAVITAAIAAHTASDFFNVNITNIRRVEQHTPTWSKVGREQTVYNKIYKKN